MASLPLILEAKDIRAGYGESEVLHGLSLAAHEGEFLGIAGPNGGGKSTFLRVLAGLLKPNQGSVSLFGHPLSHYPRRRLAQLLAVIFQDFTSLYDFTVFDMVAMGRSPFVPRWKPLSNDDHHAILNAMETTEVAHLRSRSFSELSAGERQRVVIAKALAQKPSILLLDEPSTHLDLHHQVNIFTILRRLNRKNRVTIICITHDLTLGAQYLDRLLLMNDGLLLAEGNPRDVIQKDLLETIFQTPVSIGTLVETGTPFVCPVIQ